MKGINTAAIGNKVAAVLHPAPAAALLWRIANIKKQKKSA